MDRILSTKTDPLVITVTVEFNFSDYAKSYSLRMDKNEKFEEAIKSLSDILGIDVNAYTLVFWQSEPHPGILVRGKDTPFVIWGPFLEDKIYHIHVIQREAMFLKKNIVLREDTRISRKEDDDDDDDGGHCHLGEDQ